MWQLGDFKWDDYVSGWFSHRFRRTVCVDRSTNPPTPYLMINFDYADDGDDSYVNICLVESPRIEEGIETGEVPGSWNTLQEIEHMYVGVPEHGWVCSSHGPRNPQYIARSFFNKWKWGWQPLDDSSAQGWRKLLTPRHIPVEEAVDLGLRGYAINYDYGVRDNNLFYHDTPIGSITDDGVININPDHDYAFYDASLVGNKRVVGA